MRTYLILRDRARRWNADHEVQALLRELSELNDSHGAPRLSQYSPEHRDALLRLIP
jgi:hypothetical protein